MRKFPLFMRRGGIFLSLLFISSGWIVVTEPARPFSRSIFQEILNKTYPDQSVSVELVEIGWNTIRKEIDRNRGIILGGWDVKVETAGIRREMGAYGKDSTFEKTPWEYVPVPPNTRRRIWQILSEESDDFWKNLERSVPPSPPNAEPYYNLFDKYLKEYNRKPSVDLPADKEEQMKCKYKLRFFYIRSLTPEEIEQDPSHRQLKEEEIKRNPVSHRMVSVKRKYEVQIYFNSISELSPKIREAVIEMEKLYRELAGKPLIAEITDEMLTPSLPLPPAPASSPPQYNNFARGHTDDVQASFGVRS